MKMLSLGGTWSLRGKPQDVADATPITLAATVPGCVQLDLSRAGYLPQELYMGMNITETEKYEHYEWWYERTFTAPEERENVFLVFEGVDCVAEYFLNGEKLGESENMFIAHEFEVGRYLKDGENTLTVHIKSPVLYTHELDFSVKNFMNWGCDVADTGIRRAPHTYGWDIMPRAVTSGLWRDVRLEVRDRIYFSQLYAYPSATSCLILFELACPHAELHDLTVVAEGACGDSRFSGEAIIPLGKRRSKCGQIKLQIDNPKRWMPYGYGEANVYDGTVCIYQGDTLLHKAPISFGLRTVKLERTDATDGKNGCFRFLINGVEIMAKGSNWVPLDAFHSRDAARYEKALSLVRDIGCNILRCWGGNVYEDHAFFDFCDRNGIMVWQDFAMACNSYPQDERFRRLIVAEATAVVRKLRNHPSIVLWAGDNEIDVMYKGFSLDPQKNLITRAWLPAVVDQNDPSRPFLPSSPYFGPQTTFENIPEDHLWGPRDYFKSDYYKQSLAHFVSETGYHGCPSLASIKKFITAERVWPYKDNPEWNLHSSDQKNSPSRVMLMEKQVRQLFGTVPEEPDAYILASQISQAEAKKYFIERVRVGRPFKSGVIWWNLLDGWPQMSDAVVDYYFEKKLAYHYIKRAQAPFAVIAGELASWKLPIYACNDTLTAKKGHLTVIDAESDAVLSQSDFSVGANQIARIANLPVFYSEQKMLILRYELSDGTRGFNHYLCGYPAFSLEAYAAILEKYKLGES